MNKVILAGRLGKDPEIKQAGKTNVAVLNLATSDYAGKEKGTETNWHRVVAFGHMANALAKYTKKGSFIVVEGMVKTREYEKDGQKRFITEIVAANIDFTDKIEPKTDTSANDKLPY